MPVRPENRDRYPKDWDEISKRIRFDRAQGRCECTGECGMPAHLAAPGRCAALHAHPSPYSGKRVVLTTAHLNHEPEDCADENLKAMCQGCHLWYDRAHHAETARATREALAALQGAVPLSIPAEVA